MNLPNKLAQKIIIRKSENSFRFLKSGNQLVDFCSNDYLGLARNKDLALLIEQTYFPFSKLGANGATGSRLISGNHYLIEDTEKQLADFFETESSLIFNSGYAANVGVLSSIPQKGDTVLYDELSHACIKDGIRLSTADRFSFRHNDLSDLERRIKQASGDCYIVVESVYSMDGDSAPLKEIATLCQKHSCYLIVDEAHSTGINGSHGQGLCVEEGIADQVFIRIHTFGKAMGIHGACVTASNEVRDYLINFSRSFIYTTALSLHSIISMKCAFEFLKSNQQLILDEKKNIEFFNSFFKDNHSKISSNSPIHAFLIGEVTATKNKATEIQNKGFDVRPILSPTVKTGTERLRVCIHQYNSKHELELLAELLK